MAAAKKLEDVLRAASPALLDNMLRVPSPSPGRGGGGFSDSEGYDNLEEQIVGLHGLVQEMKDGFVLAMQELSRIQNGDHALQQTLEAHKQDSDDKVQQLTKMVESLQGQLGTAVDEVNKNQQVTSELRRKLDEIEEQQDGIKQQIQQNVEATTKRRVRHARRGSGSSQSEESGFNGCEFEDPKGSVPPMLKPFIDSLPEAGANAVDPEKSDSEDSTIHAADQMMKLSRKFAEEYHRHRARLASSSTDNLLFNKNLAMQGEHTSSSSGQLRESGKSKRQRVVESLLKSERTYISQLGFIQEGIIQPLVIESIVPLNDINIMFPPILGELYQEHSAFLVALEARLGDWKWKGIMGDVLARLSGSDGSTLFKLYSTYVKSFSESLATLARHLGTSQSFYQFIERQLVENGQGKVDPMTYLMAPLQRVSHYVRLMKRLLRYTEKGHPDRFHVEACLKQLNSFVDEIQPLILGDQPMSSAREGYRGERRNSKASFSSQSSMDTTSNLRDSGIHSMEGERRVSTTSPTREMWVNRPGQSKHRPRHKSVTTEPLSLQEHEDQNGHVSQSFPPPFPGRGQQYDAGHDNGNTQLVAQYPENSVMPVPGMIGKGNNAAMYNDGRQPDDVIDTTRQKRKSRSRRMSLSRQQTFGVFGEDDTDIEHVAYVPSTPANAMPRTKQGMNPKMRQRRKSIDEFKLAFGHHDFNERLLAEHHALLEGRSNLQRVTFKSSDNLPSNGNGSIPHSVSLNDVKKHGFSRSGDMSMPLPQNSRSEANSRMYARRRSIDVGALQAHFISQERRGEHPSRSRKISHNPRLQHTKKRSPTRRTSPSSIPQVQEEPSHLHHHSVGLSEMEADAITQQMFVRTHNIPEEDLKDTRRKTIFKQHLKNIFKRRGPGSRVVELTDNAGSKPAASNNNYLSLDYGGASGSSHRKSPSPSPGSRPTSARSRARSPAALRRSTAPELSDTYVDEDGEPCSAV